MADYATTGVRGLDELLNGGIRRGSTVLVSGAPGTGKSILGTQYLYHGATERDESGVYLSFEESEADVRATAEGLGFDEWSDLVADGDVVVYDKRELLRDEGFTATVDRLLADLDDGEFDRLVLDSLTMFELFFETEKEKRTYLLKFSDILKQYGLTSLLINEQAGTPPDVDVGLENFLTDGNIYVMQTPTDAGVNRHAWVAKMRRQNVDTDIYPMDIATGGITVHDSAGGFSFTDDV